MVYDLYVCTGHILKSESRDADKTPQARITGLWFPDRGDGLHEAEAEKYPTARRKIHSLVTESYDAALKPGTAQDT